ncbi:MAG: hypothetical protein EOM14_01010 [Clostridia bacterium]|nr:hypothetical protein [Clostridia bacterium]
MDAQYGEYLALLEELGKTLDQLLKITKNKISAVRSDDLMALNECIKQEQALSLSLKSIERKRGEMLSNMRLADVPLSGLTERFPASLRRQAKEVTESVKAKYDRYVSASESARTILECALHQIEKMLPEEQTAAEGVKLPPNMGTDIRA